MFKAMLSTMSSLAVVCFFLLGTSGPAGAQSMLTHHHMHKGHKVSITGCLQKGDEAGEYSMNANGKKYGLTSTKVQLADHVGHKVMVKGYTTPESAEGTEANEQPSTNSENGGDIDVTVTSLKMISTTCSM